MDADIGSSALPLVRLEHELVLVLNLGFIVDERLPPLLLDFELDLI
jgi:hypothetical protein